MKMGFQNQDENRLRLLFDISPNMMWVVDSGGIITDSNERGLDYFGYKKEELIGKSCFDFVEHNYTKKGTEIHILLPA